ncbi:MAG TPA: hypothetical protein VFK05_37385 [Polyangiaceae bacterium]|nr:hypothetical protein [Polyangiaceae bacterium]
MIRLKHARNQALQRVASLALMLCSVLPCPACRRGSSVGAPQAQASQTVAHSSASLTDSALAVELCRGRARCSLRARHPVEAGSAELVELTLEHEPSTEACDGGEYWLVRSSSKPSRQRLASDCNAQLEADSLGHATVGFKSGSLLFDYQELQASDRCSGFSAELNVPGSHLLREVRFSGAYAQRKCQREDELSTDWDTSDHVARWSRSDCDAKGAAAAKPAGFGSALPKYTLPGSPLVTAIGSCGVKVDAARAARWQEPAAPPAQVQMRAAVVNDVLLIDIDGTAEGSLTLVVASAGLGDSAYGGLGCADEADYRVSSTTIRLGDGHLESSGSLAPFLKISARTTNGVQLSTASIAGISRAALSYRGTASERLDSAKLPKSPTARDLPPFDTQFQASDPCQVVDGRLEVRAANVPRDPIFVLR